MNKIRVKIEKIESNNQLTIITFNSKEHTLKMMSLELDTKIKHTKELIVTTKAINIALAKDCKGELSYSNQLQVSINALEMGELLCSLQLSFEDRFLESVITADSARRMNLKVGDKLTALIKSSDISIVGPLV